VRTVLLLLLADAAVGASGGVPPGAAQVVLEKEISDASSKTVLCVQIDGSDPSAALLRKLQRPDRTVVVGSECHVADSVQRPSYHVPTGRPAFLLSVSDIHWLSSSTIEVRAERFYHPKNGTFCTARLRHVGGHWELVSFDRCEEA
jgi:hypothetical protein